jgi:hypothetical protein
MNEKPLTYWVDFFIKQFPDMTKEESDFVFHVLQWEPEKRAGFIMAKKLFEEKDD